MDDQTRRSVKPQTLVAQGFGAADPLANGLVTPIHLSTTYLRNPDIGDPDNGYSSGRIYGRADNPTLHHAEALVAALEGAREALVFGSGMAAASAVFLALNRPTHIIASRVMYWGLRSWLQGIGRYGHSISFVDTSDLEAIRKAVRPGATGLFWIETPSNPLWTITDITAASEVAHSVGALLCVDSTIATPIFTRPLSLGADIVVHSATKYLNGHSDVVAGALATAENSEFWNCIRSARAHIGASLGPFEAWLMVRGLRTLHVRVKTQAETAALLASRLLSHPALSAVLYPGLRQHPGHAIAARQMKGGFGGMLSVRVRAGEAAAIATAANVRLWKRATSLGGVESLIEHRASIEGAGTPCPSDLLRLSVGLEDPDDLYDDLEQALDPAVC